MHDAFTVNAVKKAEENGLVADSMEVRVKLMEKVNSGEITLEEAQEKIRSLKRNAKKNGQITRSQAHGLI